MLRAKDIYGEITDNIISELEKGVPPWEKPWFNKAPINAVTGQSYKGVNFLNLISVLSKLNIENADFRFLTFQQAVKNNWTVKRGEKAVARVIYFNPAPKLRPESEIKPRSVKVPILRTYPVFHSSQINGMPDFQEPEMLQGVESINAVEIMIWASKADIRFSKYDAYYSPLLDVISMPAKEQFSSIEGYYGTLLHELGHWAGHSSRLNRQLENQYGSEAYAIEELIVELAMVFLFSELGLKFSSRNHISYMDSWIRVLKNDRFQIKKASSEAQKIANFLMSFTSFEEIAITA